MAEEPLRRRLFEDPRVPGLKADAIPIAPSTSTIALIQVSVATARSPVAINPLMSWVASGLNPILATMTFLTSDPMAAELTASKGKAESAASAAKAILGMRFLSLRLQREDRRTLSLAE